MTIEGMHIAIDAELQKVYTYTQKNLLPQEKDFFLNGEVFKFIKQRINPLSNLKQQGSDSTTKRLEDLSDLTRYEELDVQVDDDEKGGICLLPDDYYSYISSRSNVYQTCEDEEISTASSTVYKGTFPLSFPTSTVLSTYIISLVTDSVETIIFNMADLPTGYLVNVDINKQMFMLIKAMKILIPENLDNIEQDLYSFYWERYGEDFLNNEFIIQSDSRFDYIKVEVNATTTAVPVSTITYNKYSEITHLWSKNRLLEDEIQDDTEHSYLSKSRPNSPVIQLKQNVLRVKFPSTSICQKVKLQYIARPTILDYMLQRNLNMKDTVAREIVSNTVRLLKGVFKGDYQTYLNENALIE